MRYFFNGKIDKVNDLYTIRIPFNVWEVCKKRDVIEAELVLDNKIIECDLIPEAKGNYKIHLQEDDVSHVDITKEHKILLHITKSLIQINQNSPYSFDNPIRKIDGIDIIIQPEDGLCGQTCVAMLAGITIAEVISVMDCREWQALPPLFPRIIQPRQPTPGPPDGHAQSAHTGIPAHPAGRRYGRSGPASRPPRHRSRCLRPPPSPRSSASGPGIFPG